MGERKKSRIELQLQMLETRKDIRREAAKIMVVGCFFALVLPDIIAKDVICLTCFGLIEITYFSIIAIAYNEEIMEWYLMDCESEDIFIEGIDEEDYDEIVLDSKAIRQEEIKDLAMIAFVGVLLGALLADPSSSSFI